MTKARLETFSDGIIAIVITVMVLEFKVPSGTDWAALRQTLPELAGYLISFTYLGIYWNNHHHMFHLVRRISGSILWFNLHLLFWLSLVPFGTEWARNSGFVGLPVTAYGVILLMAGIAYWVLQIALVAGQGTDSEFAQALGSDLKGKASIGIYVIAIAFSFWAPYVSDALFVLVASIWFIPDKRFEKKLPKPQAGA